MNLLHEFNIHPSAVVGHSSGEIAAAYAAGYLCRESAWKLAYFRGVCSAELARSKTSKSCGAMMSVGLSEAAARDATAAIAHEAISFGVSIACINSPNNVTISGEEHLIDRLKARFDEQKIFARKLRVTLAYHSRQMVQVADKYASMIGSLSKPKLYNVKTIVPMISTVTGEHVSAVRLIEAEYWARNMVSPVQFSSAISAMCTQSSAALIRRIDRSHVYATVVDHLLELGPHATLQGPLQGILRYNTRGKLIGYNSVLRRGKSALETMLNTLGELHCMGAEVNLRAVNEPNEELRFSRSLLVNLPEYPFDHSQRFWHESRLSRNYRLRENTPSEFLGVRSRDWNPQDARWRHFIRTAEIPWTKQHIVNGTTLYPGTGMLVMAIEAARQLTGAPDDIAGFTLRDVHISGPIDLSPSIGSVEVQTCLRNIQSGSRSGPTFEFVIRTYTNNDWVLNCRGLIAVELLEVSDNWQKKTRLDRQQIIADGLKRHFRSCQTPVNNRDMYSFLKQSGYEYGPSFQTAHNQLCNAESKQATAEVNLFSSSEESHVVHPVSLDIILHLCFTAFSAGGTQPMATSIPTGINYLWVSHQGLNSLEHETVKTCVTITDATRRGFSCAGGALASGDSDRVVLWYKGLQLTNVTSTPPSLDLPNPKQWCMNIEHKVALDKLTSPETKSLLEESTPIKQDSNGFFEDLELLVETTLEQLVDLFNTVTIDTQDKWKRRYLTWAEYHVSRRRYRSQDFLPVSVDKETFQELCHRLSKKNHVGRLYTTISSKLIALFKGEVSPLELLMKSDLLKNYYAELAEYRNTLQAAAYIDLLAHQTPGLKFLEIGGGTASATRPIISVLRAGLQDSPGSSLRCASYDFTDVSSAFLEEARDEFSSFQSQMSFKTLDVEKDFAEQGFKEGSYDVIVADDVIHATSNIGVTLRNIRKALKPGGKLVMTELLKPDGWTAGFVFGVFPGWWLATDEAHTLSPNLTVQGWNNKLIANGFSGADLIFRDFDDDVSHHLGSIISTAISETPAVVTTPQAKGEAVIIIDRMSAQQQSLAEEMIFKLQESFEEKLQILGIDEAFSSCNVRATFTFVLFLADYGASFLTSLNDIRWSYLQYMIQRSRRLLWVSAGGGTAPHPDYGMIDGLARTLRSEFYEHHLVTVALDIAEPSTDKGRHLVQVTHEMLAREPLANYEQEYLEIDGHLHIRRLTEAQYLKHDMDAKLIPYEVFATPINQTRFEMAIISSTGHEDTPHYVELPPVPSFELEGNIVDIEVKAVSLQTFDRAAALGHNIQAKLGSYCSGVVLRVGPDASFGHGDRVIVAQAGLFRSHVQVSSTAVVQIPAGLSFSDACWVIPPMVTAYKALVEVGCANPSDAVLVVDGGSPIGQAALRLLIDYGVAETWTTASSESEVDWITQNLGVSPERILPRDWFENNPMLVSQWNRWFDIIFSPSTESKAPLMTDFVCSGGKYIVLRNDLSSSSGAQQIYSAPPSIFLSVIQPESHCATLESLVYAAKMSEAATRNSARNHTTQYEATDLPNIFSHLQIAREQETIVVNLTESNIVNVIEPILPFTKWIAPTFYAHVLIKSSIDRCGELGFTNVHWILRLRM